MPSKWRTEKNTKHKTESDDTMLQADVLFNPFLKVTVEKKIIVENNSRFS